MKATPERRRVGRLRRGITRCLMVWVAVLSLLPVLSPYVHLLLVQHATCPEHGEIIDQPAAPGQSSAVIAKRHAPHAVWQSTESDDQHRHDHCAFVLSRRQLFVAYISVRTDLAPQVEQRAGYALYDAPPASAIAVLHFAPKQSPPA